MAAESFISQYEQFGRDWLFKDGPKWQGKDSDKAIEALTAAVEKRVRGHIDDVGTELLGQLSVDKPTVAIAAAGLIRLGKILVGALMNHAFINKVLLEFALHDQEIIDKLNEDLEKVCKLGKVAELKHTAQETFRRGLNCFAEPHADFLPNVGHMNNVGSRGYKVYSACRMTIIKMMTLAEIVHCQTFVPLALRREWVPLALGLVIVNRLTGQQSRKDGRRDLGSSGNLQDPTCCQVLSGPSLRPVFPKPHER